VFLSRVGAPHSPSNVLRALKRDAGRAGIGEHVHPHLLRHTFASALLLAGRPVTEVAYLLGHASAATTLSVYAHWVRRGAGGAAAALTRAYQDVGGGPDATGAEGDTAGAGR
jgi:integrase